MQLNDMEKKRIRDKWPSRARQQECSLFDKFQISSVHRHETNLFRKKQRVWKGQNKFKPPYNPFKTMFYIYFCSFWIKSTKILSYVSIWKTMVCDQPEQSLTRALESYWKIYHNEFKREYDAWPWNENHDHQIDDLLPDDWIIVIP